MHALKKLIAPGCVLAAGLVFASAPPATAQQEPHYLHALSQLRSARDYIQYDRDHNPNHGKEDHISIDEINKAIDEIKHAAWDDGKNTQFAPPAAGATNNWAPIHYAYNYLVAARTDVTKGVDPPQNIGLRDRAIHHVAVAIQMMRNLMDQQGAQ